GERQTQDASARPPEDARVLSPRERPQLHDSSRAARGQAVALRTEGDGRSSFRLTAQAAVVLIEGRVPPFQSPLGTRGDDLSPVAAEPGGEHRAGVTAETPLRACLRIPDTHRAVQGRGDDLPAVGAVRRVKDLADVCGQGGELLAGRDIVNLDLGGV